MWRLSDGDLETVLGSSLRTLDRVGCKVQDATAREALSGAGARVDGERVRLDEATVLAAVSKAPRTVRLHDRRGGSIELGNGQYLSTGSDAQFLLDADGETAHPGTLAGLARVTGVADALPGISVVAMQLVPADEAGSLAQLRAIVTLLTNTAKPIFVEPTSLAVAHAWTEMLVIADADLDLSATPRFCAACVTQSPLRLDAENARKLIFLAEHAVPAMTMPCPMAGASSPFTLAGTLALTNAEALLQVTLVQAVRPGAPVIYGSAPTIMDMPTGTVTYATPEHSLLCAGMARISRRLGLPCYTPMVHPDAIVLDEQCAAEKAFSLMSVLSSGVHLFGGAGALAKTTVVSCEQLVIDDELLQWARRYFAGIRVDEETLAEATIAAVGPEGDFFTSDNTLRYLRSGEHWRPRLSNRRLAEIGGATMLGAARERVAQMLAQARPQVPETVAADLERYARERGAGLDRRES